VEASKSVQHEERASEPRDASARRALLATLALALLGFVGALPLDPPGPYAGADPLFALAWAAVIAPVAGAAAVWLRVPPWPYGLAAPAAWVGAVLWGAVHSPRLVPTPLWAAAAWIGLFALGGAAAELARSRPARAVYALALATCALNLAPFAPGLIGAPWPPAVSSRLLDFAPLTLVIESAGLDWQRHEFVYRAAQTDRFERAAFSGALAGPLCLLLGYVAWVGAWTAVRRRTAAVGASAPSSTD